MSSLKRRKKGSDDSKTHSEPSTVEESPQTNGDHVNGVENSADDSFEEGAVGLEDIYIPPPPPTAFIAHEDGSRLIITKIVNENFKSFADIQQLGPFHKYFSSVTGPNGSGKSNVIDSMLFVFGYRANRLRSKKISALLHESLDHPKGTSCTVTVHFALMVDIPDDLHSYTVKPESQFYISRTVSSDNTSYYTINGKKVTFKEVGKLLRDHGIDLDHNRFLILQGEVEQISLMKPKGETEHEVGMLEYLEDIIGSSRFKKPIDELEKKVELQSEIRDQKWHIFKMTKSDLEDLKAPMEAALKYVQLDNAITALNHMLLQKKIFMGEKEISHKKEIVQKLENKLEELQRDLMKKRQIIKEKESENNETIKHLEKLTTLKESAKASFEATKLNDVALQQVVENTNKKRKELTKALVLEEEKKVKLEKVPDKNKQTIAELEGTESKLEEDREEAEDMHSKIMETLGQDTLPLQDEKEKLQMELVELKATVAQTKSKYELAKTELDINKRKEEEEKVVLNNLKKRMGEIKTKLQDRSKEMEMTSKCIPENEKTIEELRKNLESLRRKETTLLEEIRNYQLKIEEARVAMKFQKGRGKVLNALMQQKSEGKIPGIIGRMGDLGAIDEKYDVAVSTACGPLDNIVVDTVDTASDCIEYLKENNIGSATFIALDRQQRFREIYSKPFRAPENVPRLFDLIQVADERLRPAFYYGLQDTLVADDLDQAMRIAYGKTRYRVVTLTGELIEKCGTMTGGGNQVFKGRMGRKVEQQSEICTPKELEKMKIKLDETVETLNLVRTRINTVEDEIPEKEKEHERLVLKKSKLKIELDSLKSLEPMIKSQIESQEEICVEVVLDKKRLSQLTKAVEETEARYKKAVEEARVIEKQVKSLHDKIISKTKGRLDAAQKKVDDAREKLEKLRKEKTRLKVALTTAERNIKKSEEKIAGMKEEIEECAEKIKKNTAEIKENEVRAQKMLEEFQKYEEELETLQDANAKRKLELDKMFEEETKLKAKEIDLKEELSKAKNDYDQKTEKVSFDKRRLQSLEIIEEPLNEEIVELKTLTEEELEELDVDDLMEKIKTKESSLPKPRPYLGAIEEYVRKQKLCLDREKDLEKVTDERNKTRDMLEDVKKARLTEFTKGFNVISQKVKECYQMLAEGGDAELELGNSMDPFLDGVRFTVRPPKKSWKEIQYLSGGEKTLSSLSLMFALHYYKPNPLYFMDEIDAALDWKNTAIVGYYLKQQTKNAQFIIVSLRENMFEIANQLVGIFKTNNSTKTVTIIPRNNDPDPNPAVEGGNED